LRSKGVDEFAREAAASLEALAEELEGRKERLAAPQATAAGCQKVLERLRSARRKVFNSRGLCDSPIEEK
jgi:hypothetical protein